MRGDYILEMIDIDKAFPGVQALNHAQLRLERGSIHALVGENGAGKSTLMKCLFGIYKKDYGQIVLDGKEISFADPRDALDNGVAMVHQELNQVFSRNVMENIWLGRFPKKHGLVDHKKMYEDTLRIFQELEIQVDPRQIIQTLSVSQRQMVEIAKAISYNAKVIVLDEPTSSLMEDEVNRLFRILQQLARSGVGVIYISHRMNEIKSIADTVTVMRDGMWITTKKVEEMSVDEIIRLMVNRDMGNRFPPKTSNIGEVLLDVCDLSGKYEPTCHDVSFQLHKGEILGVAGLVGSRRTELLETLFGIARKGSGSICLHGTEIENSSERQAVKNGFALVTEERRETGIFGDLDITSNTTVANIRKYAEKRLMLSKSEMSKDTEWVIQQLSVKTPDEKAKIRNLSGGNQQKVIIGRWLLTKPEIMLLDEPTRGIDVGAKYDIYQLILQMAGEGKGVIMVSSEMPELIGICDRILVMSNGRMSGILDVEADEENTMQERIMHLAMKYV